MATVVFGHVPGHPYGKAFYPRVLGLIPGGRIVTAQDNHVFDNGLTMTSMVMDEMTNMPSEWVKAIWNRYRGTISCTVYRMKPRKITYKTNTKLINQRRYNGHKH